MHRLEELARVIRSKNAGPFVLTVDILFADMRDLERAARAPSLSAEVIAQAYGVTPADVTVMVHEPSCALKLSFRRPVCAGALEDRDLYGAQQHVPLLGAAIP